MAERDNPNYWEGFARKNAEYFIRPYTGFEYATADEQAEFYESGHAITAMLMERVRPYLHNYGLAIEVGCGIGRLALAHAKLFREVHAVDVAPTMLSRMRKNARERGISNIKTFLPSEPWDQSADYIYSYHVFQHIDDFAVIKEYVRLIAKALVSDGVALLHFDTRPQSLPYHVKTLLPDFVLPKPWRRGIRRIRRDPAQLCQMFRDNGLEIIQHAAFERTDLVCGDGEFFLLQL